MLVHPSPSVTIKLPWIEDAHVILRVKQVIWDPAWPVLRLCLNVYEHEMLIESEWLEAILLIFLLLFFFKQPSTARFGLVSSVFHSQKILKTTIRLSMGCIQLNGKLVSWPNIGRIYRLTYLKRKPLHFQNQQPMLLFSSSLSAKFFTAARESNGRQTFDWMNLTSVQALGKTRDVSNSKWMHQCDASVVILPIQKKYHSALLMLSSR